jgi:serine/threonine protein kinase
MADTQHQPLAEGTHIGVFEIKGVQRTDRFSITYNAWNQHLNAQMSVKEYFPCEFALRTEDGCTLAPKSAHDQAIYNLGMNRFLEQAENLMSIDHPNVVRVQNRLQANGTAYMVVEYERGVPLENLCDRSDLGLGEEELRIIFLPILEALQQAHDTGFIHGDINPSVILLRDDGEPVLVNFAVDRLALCSDRDILETILAKSCAPAEQFSPDNHPGPWTDLYALGATMYRCVTGIAPVASQERTAATQEGAPDPYQSAVKATHAGYSENLLSAIDWMMRLNVQDRPQSVADVLAALRGNASNDAQAPPTQKGESGRSGLSYLNRDGRYSHWIGTGFVVVALAALGFWYLPQRERNPQEDELNKRELADSTTGQVETTVLEKTERNTVPDLHHKNHTTVPYQPPTTPQPGTMFEKEGEANDGVSEGATADNQDVERAQIPTPTITEAEVSAARAEGEQNLLHSPTPRAPNHDVPTPLTAPARIGQKSKSATATSERRLEQRSVESTPGFTTFPESAASNTGQAIPSTAFSHASPPQNPSAETVEETIEEHMAAAEKDLAALRLTTPLGTNALEHYQTILALEPDYPGAREGLEMIVDRYVWLIGKAIHKGSLQRARIYLRRAEGVSPEAPALQKRRTELKAAESARSIN